MPFAIELADLNMHNSQFKIHSTNSSYLIVAIVNKNGLVNNYYKNCRLRSVYLNYKHRNDSDVNSKANFNIIRYV